MDTETGAALEPLLRVLAQNTRVIGPREVRVSAIAVDSRLVRSGSLFVAMRGEHADGHQFIVQALERGAQAIVMEELRELPANVTAVIVPDCARALSQLADAFYASPSSAIAVAGITGTNGKTTTAQMTQAMMNAAGIPCATIGTLGARLGEHEWPLANTTPLAPQLHALLAQMRGLGAKAAVMEVSSHALSLQRVADVRFRIAALTNITRDHLDFHKTFEAYAGAKRKLFDMAPQAILNIDDEVGERWARELRSRKPVVTYALNNAADMRPKALDVRPDGSSFDLDGTRFEVHVPGRFNVANAVCAVGVARALGTRDEDAARGLNELRRVAGRMEHVSGAGIDVIVDYAHTPDALENVLRAARETARGRVLLVFGCGGDRDRGKRPQMGAVAARYADFTYVTSDNPRAEDPQAIIDQILPGIGNAPHTVCVDRRAAIEAAVAGAASGDVVLLAGKGHENYQVVGERILPFDDVGAARAAVRTREAAQP